MPVLSPWQWLIYTDSTVTWRSEWVWSEWVWLSGPLSHHCQWHDESVIMGFMAWSCQWLPDLLILRIMTRISWPPWKAPGQCQWPSAAWVSAAAANAAAATVTRRRWLGLVLWRHAAQHGNWVRTPEPRLGLWLGLFMIVGDSSWPSQMHHNSPSTAPARPAVPARKR